MKGKGRKKKLAAAEKSAPRSGQAGKKGRGPNKK